MESYARVVYKYKDCLTWENWSFALQTYCAVVSSNMTELMRNAASVDAKPVDHDDRDEDARRLSTTLYNILVFICRDNVLGIVSCVPFDEGLEAWRLLSVEFE